MQWSQLSAALNIGAIQEHSIVNGPGERFVIWLQGCSMRCPGCANPEFQPRKRGLIIPVEQMAGRILATRGIDGVTYSGGEPTLQARPLAILSRRLRQAGLGIVCYTGYTLEELRQRNNPWLKRLLSQVDVVIAGPFIHEQATNLLWRGSRNQQVHFLTDRYREWVAQVDQETSQVELLVSSGSFTITGFWPTGFVESLINKLRV